MGYCTCFRGIRERRMVGGRELTITKEADRKKPTRKLNKGILASGPHACQPSVAHRRVLDGDMVVKVLLAGKARSRALCPPALVAHFPASREVLDVLDKCCRPRTTAATIHHLYVVTAGLYYKRDNASTPRCRVKIAHH